MTDEEILKFIKELDVYIPKIGAEARLVAYGETALYANKEGFLRMAVELMKCAFEETHPDACMHYLFDKSSDFGIDNLARTKEQLASFTS
ncbi:hypothetical protein [Thalassolituus sp. C2-1]|uniref:hypothetical protein n=1 Tax=Venatorbacter sp. C2-1 TaxID=2597518 RepID=UPI0011953E74|nr:hypothetical protein [Thalassolituus sp. C2-1]TVV43151.1 hypothetical protein FOT50_11975 [Thalassolituus sp. C2-1]